MSEEFKTGGYVPRPHTVASYISMSREFELDVEVAKRIRQVIEAVADRRARPWRYPDPNPMPEIVLFPRLAKVERWLTRN